MARKNVAGVDSVDAHVNPDQSELVTVIDWIKDNTIDKLIKVV